MSEQMSSQAQRLADRDDQIRRAQAVIERLPKHHRDALRYEFDRAETEARMRFGTSR